MKKIAFFLVAAFLISGLTQNINAQSPCVTGKVDPRIAPLMNMIPSLSLEQEKAIPIEARRNMGGPPGSPLVQSNSIRLIRITSDSIPVTVFLPDKPSQKPLPVIIFYMGGGFISTMQPMANNIARQMANQSDAVVFSVDYRVAPEFRFPIPVMDCYHAFQWVAQHATRFGGDTSKIMLNGGSAGANMAAAVCLLAKSEGWIKKIKLVSLFCPVVDYPDSVLYPSAKTNAKGYGLTLNAGLYSLETYLGPNFKDSSDFRLFPIRAKDFSGLPPTLIFTAEFDILRDQGIAYAKKLEDAGTIVYFKCFPGETHMFMGLPPDATEWKEMNDISQMYMKKYL